MVGPPQYYELRAWQHTVAMFRSVSSGVRMAELPAAAHAAAVRRHHCAAALLCHHSRGCWERSSVALSASSNLCTGHEWQALPTYTAFPQPRMQPLPIIHIPEMIQRLPRFSARFDS